MKDELLQEYERNLSGAGSLTDRNTLSQQNNSASASKELTELRKRMDEQNQKMKELDNMLNSSTMRYEMEKKKC